MLPTVSDFNAEGATQVVVEGAGKHICKKNRQPLFHYQSQVFGALLYALHFVPLIPFRSPSRLSDDHLCSDGVEPLPQLFVVQLDHDIWVPLPRHSRHWLAAAGQGGIEGDGGAEGGARVG